MATAMRLRNCKDCLITVRGCAVPTEAKRGKLKSENMPYIMKYVQCERWKMSTWCTCTI